MLERWTRFVLRFRFAVLACWLVVLVTGVWSSSQLPALLVNSFAVPGTDSDRARAILADSFDERDEGAFTVVFQVRRTSDKALRARLAHRLERGARAVPTGRAGTLQAGGGILYGNVETTLALSDAKRHTTDLRRALTDPGGPAALVTGQPAIQHDLDPIFASDLRRGEAIALPAALLVLLAVLGLSLAVAIPFVFAACTIAGAMAAVYGIAHVLSVATYVTNLVVLIGLGLAIDYSLLVVYRFREELGRGLPAEDAILRTMATAGRAVVFSGLAVATGLATLVLVPVPFVRSLGIGGLLIPLVSIAAALTLQPALLSLLERHALRLGGTASGRRDVERGIWARLARAVMRRPAGYLAAGSAVLLAAAAPVLYLELTPASVTGFPSSPASVRGYELLRERVGPGAITPIQMLVDAGAPERARRPETRAAIDRLADDLFHDPEVYLVASGPRAPYVDRSSRYARVIVVGRHEYGDGATRSLVDRLRDRLVPEAHFPAGVHVYAGGAPAQGADFLERIYGTFPWLILAVLVLTYGVLLRAFRSLLLPLKAVLLNLLSVAAAYGLLVVVFRWGVGADALRLYHLDQVDGWVPIFLFATLFGLSMDYEVFMVMRMREAWDDVPDNARAVAHGLERTGGVVTAAALIMVAAFSGFVAGRVAGLQEFGVGLALAVLIDVTVVRAILVPSLMAVLGRYNWWLPASIARLARVTPSPLAERSRHGT